jgi:sentrin-specific protease 1
VDLTRGGITIEDVFEGPENDEVIIHKYSIQMTRKDLCKLKVGVWVNDEIINFYVGLLRDRDEELYNRSRQDPSSLLSIYQKYFFATTFFFAKLLVQGIYTYPNVARWTRDVDVFSLKQL